MRHPLLLAMLTLASLTVPPAVATGQFVTVGAPSDTPVHATVTPLIAGAGGVGDGTCAPTTLTQSIGSEIIAGTSANCGGSVNAFLRVLNLPGFGINDPFDVCSVQFAVDFSSISQSITVNLYTLDGPLLYQNMTLLDSGSVVVPAIEFAQAVVGFDTTVPAGSMLVIEVVTPFLTGPVDFLLGSNPAGQFAPSYLVAPTCSTPIPEPTDTAALGVPNSMWLMSVTGSIAPTGNCCFIDGACTDDVLEADCTTQGGVFAATATCAGMPCPQPCGSETHTQSGGQFSNGATLACVSGGFHADNAYMRVFDLATLGITTDYTVCEVDFGIDSATSSSGSQPVTVNLFTLDGPLLLGNLTLVGAMSTTVPDSGPTIATVPVTGVIPADGTLVVQIFTPGGAGSSSNFRMGGNDVAQTGPSYWWAPFCGESEPVDLATIGFPEVGWVINVSGDAAPPCTADVDGNDEVGFGDVLDIIGNWGPCPGGPCPWDVNGDGDVGFADILEVVGAWGPCA